MSKTIPLTRGYVATVDDEDYDWLSQRKWHANVTHNGKVYAQHGFQRADKTNGYIKMHRLILGITDRTIQADHIDGDTLNNRRSNLRVCKPQENQHNRQPQPFYNGVPTTSHYKGVTADHARRKWQASIGHNSKCIWLGRFATEEEAAKAYDEAALRLFGEFARPNFPIK